MISKSMCCNKCGKDIPCYNNMAITENSALIQVYGVGERRTSQPQRIDLCPDCYQKFINWFESEVTE